MGNVGNIEKVLMVCILCVIFIIIGLTFWGSGMDDTKSAVTIYHEGFDGLVVRIAEAGQQLVTPDPSVLVFYDPEEVTAYSTSPPPRFAVVEGDRFHRESVYLLVNDVPHEFFGDVSDFLGFSWILKVQKIEGGKIWYAFQVETQDNP
ncbi:MAG: hypothetical protein KKA90_01260 [Nanoarchaeota archaeon]|nr:hypothetical protein [Nanoarchaeota archaeon]